MHPKRMSELFLQVIDTVHGCEWAGPFRARPQSAPRGTVPFRKSEGYEALMHSAMRVLSIYSIYRKRFGPAAKARRGSRRCNQI